MWNVIKPTIASEIAPQGKNSAYPEPFARLMEGRSKRKLGDHFDLRNFGVNLTELQPGGTSALLHRHTRQDEFIYVVDGEATVICGDAEYTMVRGDCIGFRAGNGIAHQLVNRSNEVLRFLEIGDRTPDDKVDYPNDDIAAEFVVTGHWEFTHKNGLKY